MPLTVEDIIQNCTQLMEQNAIVAGVGNRMRNPLLSVFLGSNAVQHIEQVQATYFSCWSGEAKKLKIMQGLYTPEQISAQLAMAGQVNTPYHAKNVLRVIWYWDIMDDDFEQQFECVKQAVHGPVGMRLEKNYFIFCSQQDQNSQEKAEKRLKELIEWNQNQESKQESKTEPMLILSDATRQGPLDASGVAENYHIAASVVLMLNSVPGQLGDDFGNRLDFDMRSEPFWSASYCVCVKNSFDIIGVSLLTIIKRYQEMSKVRVSKSEVQARICGDGGNYLHFLDDVFEQLLAPLCPAEGQTQFWADLPYTQDFAALERKLTGASVESGGVFGRLFKKSRAGEPGNAIQSVQPFWEACVSQYYMEPVRCWLDSPEGEQAVLDYMYGKMTKELTLSDMKSQLPAEWEKLERDYQTFDLSRPRMESLSLPTYLHHCAMIEVKEQIYGLLLARLRQIMMELHQNADGFESLLTRVAETLQGIQMDPSVERAYSYRMEQIIGANPDILNQKIHPCKTEEDLLRQLEQTFVELANRDQERAYYYTLQEDLDFQINMGAKGANNVIANCFNFNMRSAGRLVTMTMHDGQQFCIMNDSLQSLIGNQNIGTRFIVNRCDRIERLYLYPVSPETIQYR